MATSFLEVIVQEIATAIPQLVVAMEDRRGDCYMLTMGVLATLRLQQRDGVITATWSGPEETWRWTYELAHPESVDRLLMDIQEAVSLMDTEQIRQWILADESLYLQAREAGVQARPDLEGDNAMYANMAKFIRDNRARLTQYIHTRLKAAP